MTSITDIHIRGYNDIILQPVANMSGCEFLPWWHLDHMATHSLAPIFFSFCEFCIPEF